MPVVSVWRLGSAPNYSAVLSASVAAPNGGMRFLSFSVTTPLTARGAGPGQDAGRKPCLAKISCAAGERRKAAKASAAAFWREAFGMAHG